MRRKRHSNTYMVTLKDNALKIYINGIIHVSLKQQEIIGFQTWVEGSDTKRYIIEFYTEKKTFITGTTTQRSGWLYWRG